MRWFKENAGWPFSCILQQGGELVQEFASLCPTAVLNTGTWREVSRRRRIFNRIGLGQIGRSAYVRSLMRNQVPKPALIYCNTIAARTAFEFSRNDGSRVLCHVHELEFVFRAGVGLVDSSKVLAMADRFIACSHAVAKNLERHGVSEDRIDTIHEFIPTRDADDLKKDDNRRWLRERLKIPSDCLIVAGSGWPGWRKGSDLFVQAAKAVRERRPDLNLHFLWLGSAPDLWRGHEFLHDVELCKLTDYVTLIPAQPDPLRYYSGADIFLLTSREDPYPLVVLEAAACGVPTICFDGAGGMPEFVENDCGNVVPYLDVRAMASAVIQLADNPDQRASFGDRAYQKVRARHDIKVAAPMILTAMERTIKAKER